MEDWQAWLEVLLQKNLKQNSIAKILSIQTKTATKKGDNYMSEIKRVRIEAILKSGKKIRKSIIVKTLPSTEYQQVMLKECSVFIREIAMYRDVISSMEDVLNEFGDYTEPMWPQMIDYRPYDLIVMNDLAECGYRMGNRKEGLDLEHCLLVMRSLAKFHATSLIVKDRGYIPMDIFGKHVFNIESSKVTMVDYYTNALNHIIKIIESEWEPEWKPITEKLRANILPRVHELGFVTIPFDPTRFNVLNHGDCWVNNLLFKYGMDSITPISIKFVDLQISFFTSPVFDLQYFLSTSPNLDVRKNSLIHLLKVYHEMLVKQLELYQYEGSIITYEQLLEDFKEARVYSFLTAVTLLPFVYRDENDDSLPEIEDIFKDLKNQVVTKIAECDSPLFIAVLKQMLTEIINDNSLS